MILPPKPKGLRKSTNTGESHEIQRNQSSGRNSSLAIQGKWTVTGGRGKVWGVGFDTWEEAYDFATIKSAEWHMQQVVKLMEETMAVPASPNSSDEIREHKWEKLSDTGLMAQSLIDDIDTWGRENGHLDPRTNERHWLA